MRARCRSIIPALLLVPTVWSGPADAAEVIKIEIAKLVYRPAAVTAHVGDTVEWTNHDFIAHTATARNGGFDVNIAPNKTMRIVLKQAGVIDYYCRFHPNMTGKITVPQ